MEIKLSHGCGAMGQKRTRMHDDTSTPDANLAEMTDTDDSPEEACLVLHTVLHNA